MKMKNKFSGKEFAEDIINKLKKELSSKKLKPKMVTILVGEDTASHLYTKLKQKAAKEIGAEMIIIKYSKNTSFDEITKDIKKYNKDKNIHGIMIQMPLPDSLINKTNKLVNLIDKSKDVDGLRENSNYEHPTAMAIMKIFKTTDISKDKSAKILVVGSLGMVGKNAVKLLERDGYFAIGVDKDTDDLEEHTQIADVIISATGKKSLIDKSMVKEGVVCIDVGSPKGDFAKEVEDVAGFITPVPGGVGPVTIACLMQNLVSAVR